MAKFVELKKLINSISGSISPLLYFRISYLHNRGRWLNVNKPKDLSAIWIKYLLDGNVVKNAWLADKWAVREYVRERCGEDILIPSLGVWDSAEKIDFEALPDRFALKANWGAGMNLICTDKSSLNVQEAKNRLASWLATPNRYSYAEVQYNYIQHKIVGEEFVEDATGGFPSDYKFICIKGEPVAVLACFGRETGHASYLPMTLDWKPKPEWYKGNKSYDIPKPAHLTEMIDVARKLSTGIELVRVDLYDTGEKILFGEMTLTPAGCIFHRWSNIALEEFAQIFYSTE